MLDNERLIYKMLLEQKLRLVTSATFYKSSPVGAYEFPVVRFSEKPFYGKDVVLTQFPSDRTLLSSFNTELVEKVFACAGEEARSRDVYDGYYSCNDPKAQKLSSSHYLVAQYLSARNRGAKGKQPTAHEVVPASFEEEKLRKNLTDTVLGEGEPDVVIAQCIEDAELYLKNQDFHGLVYGVAASPEEAARYFFAGCAFVYLKEDFFSELLSFFDLRTKNYRVAYGEYKDKKLSLKELDRRARILDIFDEGIIDNACDRVINYLKKQKKSEVTLPEKLSVAEAKAVKNEEEEHSRLSRQAARESAVLLKNVNNFLPLKRGMKVALVGEYLENYDFQRETFSCKPTSSRLPIDFARDYEDYLSVTGYAVGYRRGEGVNEELISNAARLASASECTLVFLSADPKSGELPENQKLLVKALLGWNIKVVVVIAADRCVETEFAKNAQAILYMGRSGQEAAAAAFDLLVGEYSPSGKLPEAVEGAYGYPFGFGLTYTTFEYRDLQIDESGVTVIVENKGGRDASAVVQLYLQKDGSMYADKTLKGFAKEFVKKGDAVRVTIPFTENTFRYYDWDKRKYRTEGGEYKLFISECATADKLTGTVKIAADDGSRFTNTISETTADGKKVAFTETKGLKEKQGMSFGMKLFLAISLFVYYNAVMAILLFADFVPVSRTTVFYAAIGAATGVIDILIIVFIIVISVKRQKPPIATNDTLTDLVDKVDEFVEIAKLTYPDPVKERQKAKKAQEEEEARKAEEEKKEKEKAEEEKREAEEAKANAEKAEKEKQKEKEEKKEKASEKIASQPSLDKPVDYPEAGSFEQMHSSFRQYLMERGINIGAASARRLLAAIAASRLVLVTSKNAELMPEFVKAVNGYFGGLGVSTAADSWNTMEDLLWQEVSGRSTYSTFTNTVIDTSRRRYKNGVAIIENVDSANLPDWLSDIVKFASSPSENHRIVLNEDAKFVIPQNLCVLLFAKENNFETELPRGILNAALIVDVSIRRAESVEAVGQAAGAASYPNFCALVREAREKYFISEKNWGKIDALFEFVNASGESLPFGNKNTLMAEKFTSVLMACGAEESEALTSLLRFKIIPLLKTTKMYAADDGVTVLSDFLTKTFPDEELAKVQKVLSERPKKAEEREQNAFYTPDYRGSDINAAPEETVSEPIYASAPEETVSEPIYASAPEAATSEPIYASAPEEPISEPAYTGAPDSSDNAAPEYSAPAYEAPVYDQTAYQNSGADAYVENQNNAGGYQENYGQNTYDRSAYGQSAYDQNAYDRNTYDQNTYDQNVYGQNTYDQNVYDQNAYDQQNSYGQNAYGQNGYAGYSNGYGDYANNTTGDENNPDNGGGENK